MWSRKWQQTIKIVVITSLCWCIMDVWLLSYFSNCADNKLKPSAFVDTHERSNENLVDSKNQDDWEDDDVNPTKIKEPSKMKEPPKKSEFNFLNRMLPDVLKGSSQPGDGGRAVQIPPELLAKSKEDFQINQFNLVASNLMSLNRSLPDYRNGQCVTKEKTYDVSDFPDTSVIIVFHNEAWSTLLRTVNSVINRSPRHLLKEIIMVDDASTQDHLQGKLDEYVSKLSVPVNIQRIPTRGGLIRARLKGAKAASGKILTFLDAHCECTQGWLEPLLYEIHNNKKAVVCPIIDVIDDDSFAYIAGSDHTWGGFNWRLNFRWYAVPQREMDRRAGDRTLPLRSPTMAGGLFSIDKEYFYTVGSYDPGMNIWGGENLEMSFRIWQCGGEVLIATCSRVGHVFRKISPYSWPGGVATILNHNTQRIADVWMDEYKDFFYKTNPGVKDTDPGNMDDRHKLRKKLECKSFKWYLETIYPESNLPINYVALGQIKNPSSGLCLDTGGKKAGEAATLYQCHGQGGNQAFALTSNGNIQADDVCVSSRAGSIRLVTCRPNSGEWSYKPEDQQLKNGISGQCLAIRNNELSLEKCILSKPSHAWVLENVAS
ncbi:polypeptide N-acetylgalactosaminyltransferase 13-like [Watersipora subatra]|uniref:polypeptide N-acetylgalactosaminyltransferase 13-like n=1 Tax=Watersipora subatra TaxID=2589382 RepID=UPI00355BF56A